MNRKTLAVIAVGHILVIGYLLLGSVSRPKDTSDDIVRSETKEMQEDGAGEPATAVNAPREKLEETPVTPAAGTDDVSETVAESEPASLSFVAAARTQVGKTTTYDGRYVRLAYPGGDVPIERGVCTDVVIRALRDALKMDLQKLVHEDMRAAFSSYPRKWGLRRPDRNIDHRRVANLRTYFERKGYSVPAVRGTRDYRPGDIVTCTVGERRAHIMIVSDRGAPDGTPFVIHNIGRGTKEENCLRRFPKTGHYRMGSTQPTRRAVTQANAAAGSGRRRVHVYVALADNKSQGIVPVPAKLGNGDDHANNLYWGAMYGVKTWLKKSGNWELIFTFAKPEAWVLERCVFRHKTEDILLTADAYRGSETKRAVLDFLAAAGGAGDADLAVYVGHNGLMDFTLRADAVKGKAKGTDAMVLACKSKSYFVPWLTRLQADAVLLTTGLMAPEAYTLEAAVESWIEGEPADRTRERAAVAYNKYQRCGMAGARRLFYCE